MADLIFALQRVGDDFIFPQVALFCGKIATKPLKSAFMLCDS